MRKDDAVSTMMSSPPTNQYSKLHRTLKNMPPNIPTSADERLKPRAQLNGASDGYDHQQQRHSPSSARNCLNRTSMPPISSEPMSNSPETFRSARAMGSRPDRISEISEDTEKSFTRDFFGSRRKLMKKGLFSKRNLKSDDNDESSNDSTDSLRDPMKDLPEHLKRRESQDKKSAVAMKPLSNFPPLPQNNSDRTFDNDYASMGRETYLQQRRQQHASQQQQQYSEESSSPSGHLETLQEHVMRKQPPEQSRQEHDVPPTDHSRVQLAQSTWVAAPAPPMACYPDNDDESWVNDVMHQKRFMEEVIGERKPYQRDEHYQPQHTGAPHYQHRQQEHDRQQYQRNQDSQFTRDKYDWREFYRNEPLHQQSRPHQQHPQSRPDFHNEPHPNPYVQQQRHQHQGQNYYDNTRHISPPQHQQYARDSTTSIAWDDSSIIDDILRATDARGNDGTLLSRNEILAEMGIVPPQSTENMGRGHCKHPRPQNQYPEPPSRQNQQYESRRQVLRDQQRRRQEWQLGQNRSKIPDNQSWVQEMLASRNKGVYSSDVVDFLLESLTKPPTIEEEEELLRDRNSLESWMKDIPEGASPDVLQELMEARSATGSASGSHSNNSDFVMSRQVSHDSHPTQSTHHSTVIQDQRGPVPTDDMFGDSLKSSDSNGSRIVGGEVLVVQRNQRTDGISSGSSVKIDGSSKESGQDTKSAEQTEDDFTIEDIRNQLGPGVDIESVPEHVLTALGLSKSKLRRAESMDAKSPSKSNKTVRPSANIPIPTQQCNSEGSRQYPYDRPYYYIRKSSPDDCVSFVDRSFVNRANVRAAADFGDGNHGEHSSLSSSVKEFATDDRGPIPETDMLDALSGSSSSIPESLKSLRPEHEQGSSHIRRESVEEITQQTPETPLQSEIIGDLKPSLGFMRYNGLQHGNYGDNPRDNLEAVVMKMRQDVMASIEMGRSQISRKD